MRHNTLLLATIGLAAAAPASAQTSVTLTGISLNSCVLSVSLGGQMVADASGTTMRSDTGTGARSATLAVTALGVSPTITFATPTLAAPSGFTADSVQYAYRVNGTGQSRAFGTASATATTRLIDVVAIDGLITSATGFPEGTYTETVQVTCGQ
ncbi:hypothetical protein [Qipengyuania sp. MTN3-11]|uniref:hypothetical protein n=1 Tax=Qipengyuania sp. MTN3-11 TaxID=3056557 RepID=UPI0036F2E9E4